MEGTEKDNHTIEKKLKMESLRNCLSLITYFVLSPSLGEGV